MAPTTPQPHPAPSTSEHRSRSWLVFATTFSVVAGLVGVLFSVITFPTAAAKVLAVLTCVGAAGLIWQAFRDRISRPLAGWLVATALAAVSLMIVLTGTSGEEPVIAGGTGGSESPQHPATPSPGSEPVPGGGVPGSAPVSPSADLASSQSPTGEQLPLDALTVVDGGDGWSRAAQTMGGTSHRQSLASPEGCSGTRSGDEFISYNLGREWSRFTVTIGVPDDAPTGAYGSFTVEADGTGNDIHASERLRPGDAIPLDLNVERVFRLTLRSVSGCDAHVAVWGSPTLSR